MRQVSPRILSLLVPAVLTLCTRAQDATSCEQAYGRAYALYDQDGRLNEARGLLDSLCSKCRKDNDQLQRIVFLKAVIEARNDSIKAMRRSMEQLFRNDRGYVLKPYDPIIVGLPVKEEVFTTYEQLSGSRGTGPGQLRKDHGHWRVGLHFEGHRSDLDVEDPPKVFEADAPPKYKGSLGWEAGAHAEWDMVPNLALRIKGGWSEWNLEAKSTGVRYGEKLTFIPLGLGVKKMFWIKNCSWVPYLIAEASYMMLRSATADIERTGDGLRFLAPKTLERSSERRTEQIDVGGGLGVGYKVGHVVLFVEGHYRHALDRITKNGSTYTESELLTNYYWVDGKFSLSGGGVALGLQYVLRYHPNNRIFK